MFLKSTRAKKRNQVGALYQMVCRVPTFMKNLEQTQVTEKSWIFNRRQSRKVMEICVKRDVVAHKKIHFTVTYVSLLIYLAHF